MNVQEINICFLTWFQVKPIGAGLSIRVTVAYHVDDSLTKVREIMREVLVIFYTMVSPSLLFTLTLNPLSLLI